ncbi:MAG: hypothetical protein GYB26_10680 [Gammaproteobacteria bacterium]|uniref:Uncharacterized protein n=1 Tax=Marinobacter litoralis TaxID=187981 RepID=A0A3M2RFN6_9GAMM|nr:hypothetical protein [Marinobacter litoralis]MBR9871594.1 hypothetical protein [Gammaproteobacteria bacterium]RMJ04038.1 hypothetical protein DOQ08_01358 [Marinobacter litoralis]
MSDRKQFLTVMIVAALFVGWIAWRGFEVTSLNDQLKADKVVSSYPYQHRVLRVEGDTATISSLRSHSLSTQQALSVVFPGMTHLADTHRDWQKAERELAQVQARAGDIVLASPSINRVRWELDENWYHLQFMKSQQHSAF